jgi:hypothetical protein
MARPESPPHLPSNRRSAITRHKGGESVTLAGLRKALKKIFTLGKAK